MRVLATYQTGAAADWKNLKASIPRANRFHVAFDFLFQQCDLLWRKRQQQCSGGIGPCAKN